MGEASKESEKRRIAQMNHDSASQRSEVSENRDGDTRE
jgi:hypothetical protein